MNANRADAGPTDNLQGSASAPSALIGVEHSVIDGSEARRRQFVVRAPFVYGATTTILPCESRVNPCGSGERMSMNAIVARITVATRPPARVQRCSPTEGYFIAPGASVGYFIAGVVIMIRSPEAGNGERSVFSE